MSLINCSKLAQRSNSESNCQSNMELVCIFFSAFIGGIYDAWNLHIKWRGACIQSLFNCASMPTRRRYPCLVIFQNGGCYRVSGFFFPADERKMWVHLKNGRYVKLETNTCIWRRCHGDQTVKIIQYSAATFDIFRQIYFSAGWNKCCKKYSCILFPLIPWDIDPMWKRYESQYSVSLTWRSKCECVCLRELSEKTNFFKVPTKSYKIFILKIYVIKARPHLK